MFARPVDPFQGYNSELSAAHERHKVFNRTYQQQQHQYLSRQQEQQQPQELPLPSMAPPSKKRPLTFEPEFSAALDASLLEDNVRAQARCKRLRKAEPKFPSSPITATVASAAFPPRDIAQPSVLSPCSPSQSPTLADCTAAHTALLDTTADETSTSSPSSSSPPSSSHPPRSQSPSNARSSIIDLSSGEELVALHLGDNDHKRRRNNSMSFSSSNGLMSPTSAEDSSPEIFIVNEDGTIAPDAESARVLPPRFKRTKLDNHLEVLSESPSLSKRKSEKRRQTSARGNNAFFDTSAPKNKRNGFASYCDIDMDSAKADRDVHDKSPKNAWFGADKDGYMPGSRTWNTVTDRALVRYKGLSNKITMSNGVDDMFSVCSTGSNLHQENRLSPPTTFETQGHELVLYKHPLSILNTKSKLNNDEWKNTDGIVIQELDSDQGSGSGSDAEDEWGNFSRVEFLRHRSSSPPEASIYEIDDDGDAQFEDAEEVDVVETLRPPPPSPPASHYYSHSAQTSSTTQQQPRSVADITADLEEQIMSMDLD